jgi:hypothetical protein
VRGVVFRPFPVALARGKHLFPFRTEQLSPSAPMVLGPQGPGRVGRRRFISTYGPPSGGPSSSMEQLMQLCGKALVPFHGASGRAGRPNRGGRSSHEGTSTPPQSCACVLRGARTRGPRRAKGTPAAVPAPGRHGAGRTLRAAALDADAIHGHARPGRPPSRPSSRPRATGTSGPRVGHRARAAQASMSERGRTCVRKIGSGSDGIDANVCARSIFGADLALEGRFGHHVVQWKLQSHRGRADARGSARADAG